MLQHGRHYPRRHARHEHQGPRPRSPSRPAIAPSASARWTLPANTTYNTRERITHLRDECAQAREGVGKDGDWVIDFHQRFDLSDAIRGCNVIEDLAPFFVEDPVRTEAFLQDLPILRRR